MYHEYLQRAHTLPAVRIRHQSKHSGTCNCVYDHLAFCKSFLSSSSTNSYLRKPVRPILLYSLDNDQRSCNCTVYVNEILIK